jgi:hypothetical protein
MIRVAISVEAFEAIAKTLPLAASATPEASTEGAFPAGSFTVVFWYQTST